MKMKIYFDFDDIFFFSLKDSSIFLENCARSIIDTYDFSDEIHPIKSVIAVSQLLIIYEMTDGTKGNPVAVNSSSHYQDTYRFYANKIETCKGTVMQVAQNNTN